jgi:MFS family permease
MSTTIGATPLDPDRQTAAAILARLDRLPATRHIWLMVTLLSLGGMFEFYDLFMTGYVIPGMVKSGLLTSVSIGMFSGPALFVASTFFGLFIGTFVFGFVADKYGRRAIFTFSMLAYCAATLIMAFQTTGFGVCLWRMIAGIGIGVELVTIDTYVAELVPKHMRGRAFAFNQCVQFTVVPVVALLSYVLVPLTPLGWDGWRWVVAIGAIGALFVWFLRRAIPESPRWLLTHGRAGEAEQTLTRIEAQVQHDLGRPLPPVDDRLAIEIRPVRRTGYLTLLRLLFTSYRRRAVLGASLMITQSFLYNAIFFTYTLVLTKFYGVSSTFAPVYLIAFAVGNLAGPLAIGPLFDTIGRKPMISGTYIASGAMLAVTAWLFDQGALNALTQTIAWCVIFFFASAGASAGYLTVSEIFPLEVRAEAIAVFFAIAQCFGAVGPILYGALIGAGHDPFRLFIGYLIGGGVMILGGLVELFLGVPAQQQPLEAVARPLSAVAPLQKAAYSPGMLPSGTSTSAAA